MKNLTKEVCMSRILRDQITIWSSGSWSMGNGESYKQIKYDIGIQLLEPGIFRVRHEIWSYMDNLIRLYP